MPHPHQRYTISPFHSIDNFMLLSDHPPTWSYNTSQPLLLTSSPCHGHPSQYAHCTSLQPTALSPPFPYLHTLPLLPASPLFWDRLTEHETSFHTLATIYAATQSITEDLNHQEMVWYEWSNKSLYLVDHASFSNSFYFFTNLIHLVSFTILAYLSLHVSDQSVHHQENQMLNYASSFWRRSLGCWSVVGGRWC